MKNVTSVGETDVIQYEKYGVSRLYNNFIICIALPKKKINGKVELVL